MTTGSNLYLLTTGGLDRAGQLDRESDLAAGTTGFSQTTAVASGDFAYVTNDQSEQLVLRLSDGKPVAADEFAQATGNAPVADTGVGQPSISRGFIQFASGSGVFVYRNTDAIDPRVGLTAPADGATVSGTVTLAAQAFDARGIARVEFRLNGQPAGQDTTPDSGAPFAAPGATFSTQLNTTGLANGTYVVDAVATDGGGRTATSAPRRLTVRNGGGTAAGDNDRPPTVAFTAPASGALVRGTTTLSATAGDDRGVRSVAFFDDDRLVCTDTTAPYSCTYTARGDDVGRDTLFAVAADTADQTAAAFRAIRVDRFAPASVSTRTTPSRDRRAPYRFRTTGRVVVPGAVSGAAGCDKGVVTVRVKAGRKTISTRRATLRSDCTFASTVSFRNRGRFTRSGRLRFLARFTGNDVLTARSARSRTVRTR
ncbi:MAG: Ig-like domain-containing protein [Actinomycetota bacterium]|nr:Ig-like domain-containing protein [Actinomycetota bacterium]